MALQPAVLEMGMGIDLHGQNYTLAATRAVWNAVHQSSLMFLGLFGPDTSKEMIVEVTIGIPKPEEVNEQEVLDVLPHGKGVLKVVKGGLEIEGREGSGDKTIMANAAIIVMINVP
ncbi:MAG: Lin0512 family protein [Chloroflexi bacterium]|nr:Lin0512 family protein [Chloroflexota bacterium]